MGVHWKTPVFIEIKDKRRTKAVSDKWDSHQQVPAQSKGNFTQKHPPEKEIWKCKK